MPVGKIDWHFFFSTSLFELGLMVVKEESTRFFAGPLVADAVISAAVLALKTRSIKTRSIPA